MKLIERIKARYTKEEVRDFARRMLLMLIANIGYAFTLRLFLAGNRIAGGGLSGLGIIVTSFVDIPIGLFVLLCNIPIFIWAAFVKDRGFMLTTVIASVVDSALTDLFAFLPTVTDNPLIAAVLGGVSYGVFVTVMVRAGCSTGGTDLLIKMLVTRFRHISLGTMYLLVDGLIVIASMIAFKSFELGLYAAIVIVLYSYVGDLIIKGLNRATIFYIVTDAPEPVAEAIMKEMERGVTLLRGMGMYEKAERCVLMTVVRPREVYKIKDIVKRFDPGAFAVLSSANEVMGEGFAGIDYTKNKKDVALDRENARKRSGADA